MSANTLLPLLHKHTHLTGEPGDDTLDTADLAAGSLLAPHTPAFDSGTDLLSLSPGEDLLGSLVHGGFNPADTGLPPSFSEAGLVTIHTHIGGASSVTDHPVGPGVTTPYDTINSLSSDQFGDAVLGTAVLAGGQQVVLSASVANNVNYNGFSTYPGYASLSETIIENGVPTTHTLSLSASFTGTPDGQDLAKIVPLTGGDFVVVDEARVTGTNLYFDLFDSSGTKLSSGQINTAGHNASELNDSFNLAAASGNKFVVEWNEGNNQTGHLETFSVSGSVVTGSGDLQFHDGSSNGTNGFLGNAAVATNGNVIVATNPVGAGAFASANFAIYNSTGGTVVGPTSFATAEGSLLPNESSSTPGETGNPLENSEVLPQFVALPNGNFLAVIANPTGPWTDAHGFPGFNMYLQTINATTGAFGTPELVETTSGGSDNTLNPVALSNGDVVIDLGGHFDVNGQFIPGTYEVVNPSDVPANTSTLMAMTQLFPNGVAPALGTVSTTGAVSPVSVYTPIIGGTNYFLNNYFSADNHGGVFAALQSGIFTGYYGYGTLDANLYAADFTPAVAPTVAAGGFQTAAVETQSASGVAGAALTGDSDPNGGTLTITGIKTSGGTVGTVGASLAGTYGHLTLSGNGSYTYVADNTSAIDSAPTGSHPVDSFTMTVSNGSLTTNETFAVTLDRAPALVADSYAVVESGSASGTSGTGGTGVLGNDTDKDGDSLTITAVNGSGANVGSGTFQGTYGHLNLASNGSYTYTADNTGNIDGAATGSHPVDTFTYTVSDGLGGVTTQTVSFTLDRAPTLGSDSYTVVESGSASGTGGTAGTGVLGNDTDKDGDSLTITAVNGSGANVGSGTLQGTYGHLNLASTGSFSYSADNTAAIDAAATGSHLTDSFTYTVSDGHGGSTTQSVTFTLDRAPTVTTQNESVAESGTNTGTGGTAGTGALAGDSDRDGDTVQVTKLDGNTINDTLSNFAGTYGHLTIGNDGSYSYVADNTAAIDGAATGSHPVDTFTLTVDDGHGGTTAETLNFTIDRPAVAAADSISTNESSTATASTMAAGILGNDSDPDTNSNAGLVVTAVNGSAGNVGNQITFADGSFMTVNADGTYTYDPNHVWDFLPAASSGAPSTGTETFSYTITGGSTVNVTITIDGQDSNDTLQGTAGNDTYNGGLGDDVFNMQDGGTDNVSGGAGDDTFLFGASLTSADIVNGGTNTDKVILDGDYTGGNALVLGATTFTSIEILSLNAGNSYDITTNDATVASGQVLTVRSGALGAADSVTFNGSAETDGSFVITTGAGNDTVTGGAVADTITPGAGNDTVHGGGGNDLILMTGNLTAADNIDGGSGTDTLRLNGDYSAGVVFGATTVTNVEKMILVAGHDYDLTIADATVASGASLTVNGLSLAAGDNLVFDGSADTTGGTLVINAGAGDDTLTGGYGADTIRGGAGTNTLTGGGGGDLIVSAGTDTFVYNAVSDSTGAGHDTIRGFDASIDTFRLTGITVSAIDATVAGGKLNGGQIDAANFDRELAKAIGASQLHAHDAVLFTPDSGTQAHHTFLIVDANGTAGYQAGQDLVIDITGATNLGSLSAASFTS